MTIVVFLAMVTPILGLMASLIQKLIFNEDEYKYITMSLFLTQFFCLYGVRILQAVNPVNTCEQGFFLLSVHYYNLTFVAFTGSILCTLCNSMIGPLFEADDWRGRIVVYCHSLLMFCLMVAAWSPTFIQFFIAASFSVNLMVAIGYMTCEALKENKIKVFPHFKNWVVHTLLLCATTFLTIYTTRIY